MKLARKIRLYARAVRVFHYRRKLESEQHVQWASSLLVIGDPGTGKSVHVDENGDPYYLVCERVPVPKVEETLPFRCPAHRRLDCPDCQ